MKRDPAYIKKAILIFPWSVVLLVLFASERKAEKKGIGRPGIYGP